MILAPSKQIVLVSGSPRRKELLESCGFSVLVRPTHVEESWPKTVATLEEGVQAIALRKLEALPDLSALKHIALSADTVVAHEGHVLGKPCDVQDACRMLQRLSGATHDVVTAFCASFCDKRVYGVVRTHVSFRELSTSDIERYVATGESFDKAGAYAIQGVGGALIDRVDGSYTNIVGLPVNEVLMALDSFV